MARKYYSMCHMVNGQNEHDFGSYDRSDVEYEIEDLKDHGARNKDLHLKVWPNVPSRDQFIAWIASIQRRCD